MHLTALLSVTLLVVAACELPTRPAPQPPPTAAAPVPPPAAPPPLNLVVDLRGDYTLTFEVGGGCEEVPQELRTRTYEARIGYVRSFDSSDWFLAALSAAKFYEGQQPVWIEVWRHSVGVDLSDNVILEEPSPGAYLATSGYGVAPAQPGEVSTISGSFTGYFKYCAATSGPGRTNRCSVGTMTQGMCKAENSRWTLTRLQ